MELPILFKDSIYQSCINLATNSKGPSERYGSRLVMEGEVLGKGGWNRALSNPNWDYKLERIVKQGYANHAEIEALNDILMNHPQNVEGADIYVAGYFAKSEQLFFQEKYTCVLCPPKLIDYGIKNIIIPTINGWKKRPIKEALEEAREYLGGTTSKRIESCQGEFYLDEFLKMSFMFN